MKKREKIIFGLYKLYNNLIIRKGKEKYSMIISKELSLLLLLAKSSDELEDDEYKLVDLLE